MQKGNKTIIRIPSSPFPYATGMEPKLNCLQNSLEALEADLLKAIELGVPRPEKKAGVLLGQVSFLSTLRLKLSHLLIAVML